MNHVRKGMHTPLISAYYTCSCTGATASIPRNDVHTVEWTPSRQKCPCLDLERSPHFRGNIPGTHSVIPICGMDTFLTQYTVKNM